MAQNVADPLLRVADGPRRILFVASTGGHLAQLKRLSATFQPTNDSVWVTFDSPQSRSLLDGLRVIHVPYVSPRDWRGALRSSAIVRRAIRGHRFDLCISTGAAPAMTILPQMRLRGTPAFYIESISRTDGPSLTGRLLAATQMVGMRTQHAAWASRKWRPFPPVLAGYRAITRSSDRNRRPRIFVTLGTIRPYRFDSLIDGLLAAGLVDSNTVWQLGETERSDLPGDVHTYMSDQEFRAACLAADVVITHSGVGTIMALLDSGIYPVVVPRRSARAEHVDDHQEQIAKLVSELGIAASVEATGDLSAAVADAALKGVQDA